MWILFALTSATILASRKIQEKQLVGNIGSSLGWMIRLFSAISITLLWVIFSRDTSHIWSSQVWSIIAIISLIIYPLYTLGYYYAVSHLPLSYFWMLGIIAPIANTIFSYFFFHTLPNIAGYIGICSILLGLSVLLYKHERKEFWFFPIFIAILVYSSMGLNPILDKLAMVHIDPFSYAMLNQLAAIIPIFLLSYFVTGWTQIHFLRKNMKVISIIWITQWIGWICSMYTFVHAPNVGYAVALINTHAIITALYWVIILKEKVTKRKIFVFLCMFVALISFAFT